MAVVNAVGLQKIKNTAVEGAAITAPQERIHAVNSVRKFKQAGGIAQRSCIGGEVAPGIIAVAICIVRKTGGKGAEQHAVFAVRNDGLAQPAVGVDTDVRSLSFDILQEFCQGLGLFGLQRVIAVEVALGGVLRPHVGEGTVEIHAPAPDQISLIIEHGRSAAAGPVVGMAVHQTVRVHAWQDVDRPAVVGDQIAVIVQQLHQLIGSIDQATAIPAEIVLKTVEGKAGDHHILAVSESVGHKLPARAGVAVNLLRRARGTPNIGDVEGGDTAGGGKQADQKRGRKQQSSENPHPFTSLHYKDDSKKQIVSNHVKKRG